MELSKRLATRIAVATGHKPCDLVIKNGKIVNIFTNRIQEENLAVFDGIIIGTGDYDAKQVIDVKGNYLCPGFMDGHIHIESTMLSPQKFAQAVSPRGTVAVMADPHEIANVMGLAGIKAMIKAGENLPVEIFYMLPSCVPATQMETAGADLQANDLTMLKDLPQVLGLGEMMNFPGVVNGLPNVVDKLSLFSDMPIDGHAPFLSGKLLNAYALSGPKSDHECVTAEEALEKLGKGLWIMLRQGTGAQNLLDLLPVVTPQTERRCLMVTDDRHPDELFEQGHMDHLLRLAVQNGLDPFTALRMVSFNTAQRFGLNNHGALACGYQADIAVVKDLENFEVKYTFQKGRLVAKDGKCLENPEVIFDAQAKKTVHLPELTQQSFTTKVQGAKTRVIELVPGQLLTKSILVDTPNENGNLKADPNRDLALLNVIERHRNTGNIGQGLIKGLGLKKGALASSCAHDSHNLIVAGMDTQSMLTASLAVQKMQGGLCVASGQEVLSILPLCLAGLMSDQDLNTVLTQFKELRKAVNLITDIPEPFMLLSFVALPVIPELRITDKGLVDVNNFELVDLFQVG